MDASHFDRWTRTITNASSRRGFLRGLAGTALGLAAVGPPAITAAKKKTKKKRKKKPQLNAYGCLNVGQGCGGNDALCCSGICQGKKPKKGKQDKRTCGAHDVGSCTAKQDVCTEGGPASCGKAANCYRTTGNAGFCGSQVGNCAVCTKDTDCAALGFGPGSACIVCTNDCQDTAHTACIGPAAQ